MTIFSLHNPCGVWPAAGPAKNRVVGAPTTLLLPPQGQQLGVDREDIAHRFLELPAALHSLAYPLHPPFRNPLHPLAAPKPESQRPNRVAFPLRAMTGRLAATTVSLGQGAGKALGRQADIG